ncbi:MAG: ribonuclease E/G [Candidatus Parvarchaeum sp.]
MKVKVRGIYSTAITKLLLDEKIEITQAADAIKKALKIDDESKPDVIIEDTETKEGIYVYGNESEKIVELLRNRLKMSIFYKEEIGKIYCGIIKNTDQKAKSILISLPDDEEGVLDLKSFWGYVKAGAKILVQSKGTYDGKIMLSTQLRIFGDNIIIIKNGFTKMSKGIHSNEGKTKLYDIAKGLNLKDWGILWVQGAEDKDEEVLKQELEELQKKESEINEKFNNCTEPSIIYEGMNKYFILFDKTDKNELDKIRKEVMPTIINHHKLKSAGYTILTDFAEDLLDKYSDKEIEEKINEVLLRYGPVKDKLYRLVFTRLNGTSFKVDGIVSELEIKDNEVQKLMISSRSEWGDRTYTIEKDVEYVEIFRNGEKERMMIVKPEIFPKFAKLITFDITAKKEENEIKVQNEDRLERLSKKGEISDELKEKMKKVVNEMKNL